MAGKQKLELTWIGKEKRPKLEPRILFEDLKIRIEKEQQILRLGKRAPNAKAVLNLLYRQPMVTAADLERQLPVSKPTANALLRDLQNLGVLIEITGQMRDRAFVFDRYLKLFIS